MDISNRKLVIITLDGDFQQGFQVVLEIGDEGDRPTTQKRGHLPKAPEIPAYYERWQSNYHSLEGHFRIKPKDKITNVSIIDLDNSAQDLHSSLNVWLNSESFRPIRETLLQKLMPTDEVRVLLRTSESQIWKLPWHLWDLFENYPNAEVALGALEYDRPPLPNPATDLARQNIPVFANQLRRRSLREHNNTIARKFVNPNQIKILAILGSGEGIDIDADRLLLENLPDAATTFLVEPQRNEINDNLWNQRWNILFFAGHSNTEGNDGDRGRIYINENESLTIADLKNGLNQAIKCGLQLAIFNSCDGLGLAHQLSTLQIPQMIFMRESVPDRVAQEFLSYFLKAFASGKSLYLAEREARERLQGLEGEYPYATWLPVIFQNPVVVPPTWQEFRGRTGGRISSSGWDAKPRLTQVRNTESDRRWCSLQLVFLASIVSTSLLWGVRQQGWLKASELKAFDQLMLLRPDEAPDKRLLLVTVDEEDIQYQIKQGMKGIGSLSDRALAQLLDKLSSHQPRVIGLDIYRDFPVEPEYKNLANSLREGDRLFAACKSSDDEAKSPGIAPPPEIPMERQGFSDFIVDSDGILRRHLLAFTPEPASPCKASYAFSVMLALRYLKAQGIQLEFTKAGDWKLGSLVFKTLKSHPGSYQPKEVQGHQILLNYSASPSPQKIAPQVTLQNILNGEVDPNYVKDKIVLIGVTATSANDSNYWSTPYDAGTDRRMSGVMLQAQMVSQILSAVLDRRPLIWVWPLWGEALWVWGWSLVGGIIVWRCWGRPLALGIVAGGALGILYGLSFVLFTQGAWVPLVPPILGLMATGGILMVFFLVLPSSLSPSTARVSNTSREALKI